MSFFESLRLAIALGLTLFLVLLRFDSERIIRSDYFRYRTPWMGPVSYYILVIGFAIGIAVILPSGREQLFLTGGDNETIPLVLVLFTVVALVNGVALAFLRYGGILPLPLELLPSRVLGAAANAVSEELQFRSIVLGMLLFAGVPARVGDRAPGACLWPRAPPAVARPRLVLPRGLRASGLGGRRGDGPHGIGHPCHRRALRGVNEPLRLRWRAPSPASDLEPMQAAPGQEGSGRGAPSTRAWRFAAMSSTCCLLTSSGGPNIVTSYMNGPSAK